MHLNMLYPWSAKFMAVLVVAVNYFVNKPAKTVGSMVQRLTTQQGQYWLASVRPTIIWTEMHTQHFHLCEIENYRGG